MSLHRPRFLGMTGAYLAIGAAVAGVIYYFGNQPQGAASAAGATAVGSVGAAPWLPVKGAAVDMAAADRGFTHDVVPLLNQYCYSCHNEKKPVADLALDIFHSTDAVLAKRDTWELASKYVRTHQMPPDDKPQPTEAQRKTISTWVDNQLYAYYSAHPDPGRVTIHRLNKSEYNNTVRDLVGVNFEPAADFPQDDSGYGFDNIGDVLSLPPVLMEKYLTAADRVLDEALPTEPPVSKLRHFNTSQLEIGFNARGDRGDGWAKLISLEEDDAGIELDLPAGDYIVRVKAFSEPTGGGVVGQGSDKPLVYTDKVPETCLGVFVSGTFVGDLSIDAREAAPKVYETRIGLPGGKQRISAAVRRNRGGAANETYMLNGRLGTQQAGIAYVKYMEIEGPLGAAVQRYPAKKLEMTGEGKFNEKDGWVMEHNGQAGVTFDVPKAGEYILRAQASAQQAGTEPAKMEMRVNGEVAKTFEVVAPAKTIPTQGMRLFDILLLNARPYVYETRVKLPAGKATFAAAFVNDFEDPKAANVNLRDRNLILDYLEVVDMQSPQKPAPMPATFAKYVNDHAGKTREAAREIVAEFMPRAFRRPVGAGDVERVMRLFDMAQKDGESYENSLKLALKAVLVSPRFLFRGEMGPDPNDPKSVHEIDEFALASRLSYFLWSSTPDDELLQLAGSQQLRKNLAGQVKRMLASPKSAAFVENFSGQWLQLRNLSNMAPDKKLFADFDDGLRRSMKQETEMLFENILREDRSVLEFLTADYTFVDGRLARFYGFESVNGDAFQKVSLKNTPRRGVLTQASILTLTSNPTRTSPVKRGKFVLENLMGTPPPPPPPDVPVLDEEAKNGAVKGTLRQQMEVHREKPMCASCHAQMDPIGFGLENFDAIGKWRDTDGTAAVDAAGVLKTGEQFKNASELVDILANKDKSDFEHCLAEKMLTYALGRGVESPDRPAIEKIVKGLEAQDGRFSALILEVVQSMPFQMERGEAPQ